MAGFLILGFLIGMSHALEADHLAAVGALAAAKRSSPRKLVFLGVSWGMGHATTLFLLSSVVLVFGYVLSERLVASMEFSVGSMLVLLGVHVFWKMRRAKIHFHIHRHGTGDQHIHAHSHAQATVEHLRDPHKHDHDFSLRTYLVGLAHGAAGSAGLIALTAAATQDAITALMYVSVFAIGSIFGMALLTYVVSWPMRLSEKNAGRLFTIIQCGIASFAIYIGASVMIESGPLIWAGA